MITNNKLDELEISCMLREVKNMLFSFRDSSQKENNND
jgi:hypothetical protein